MVSFVGIENLLLRDGLRSTALVQFLEEAALESGVAGAAGLLHLKEERVRVAIGKPPNDLLRMAACLALQPVLLARPAPVVHEPGAESGFERAGIHPGHHEH